MSTELYAVPSLTKDGDFLSETDRQFWAELTDYGEYEASIYLGNTREVDQSEVISYYKKHEGITVNILTEYDLESCYEDED